jgi:undecaprenyl-diphosphatase
MTMTFLIIFGAKYLVAFVALGAAALLIKMPGEQQKLYIKRGIIAGILALVLTKLSGALYFDPRPFTHGVTALIPHAPDNGFPSDHTVLSFLAALLALTVSKRVGGVLLVLSALVGLCRVISGIHSPLDVIAAAAISVVSVALALRLSGNSSVKSQPEQI